MVKIRRVNVFMVCTFPHQSKSGCDDNSKMHGSRTEKRPVCMYVFSFNIQLVFNLSVVTHKTVHTSEHNDWLWKTVRYMVQPYKIKSYSRAQHST